MPRYLRWVWLAMALLSIAGIFTVWSLPNHWSVERRIDIASPPGPVFERLVDLDRWPEWSPWQESDYEDLEFVYEGARRGTGASYHWDSETTGDGRVEILEVAAPKHLVFSLTMQGGKIQTTETLTLNSIDGGVEVVWEDRGEMLQTLLGRLSIPVIEQSMGRDLETGLERLKRAAEAGAAAEGHARPEGSSASEASPAPLSVPTSPN